jgi:hypothetical protein
VVVRTDQHCSIGELTFAAKDPIASSASSSTRSAMNRPLWAPAKTRP